MTQKFLYLRYAAVIDAICAERVFQDRKYGPITIADYGQSEVTLENGIDGPGGHDLGTWVIILEAELNEAKKALIHGGANAPKGRDSVRAEILQIAAVAVAALEQHGLEES